MTYLWLDWWLEVWHTLLDMLRWWYLASLLTLAAVGLLVWSAWGNWFELLCYFVFLALVYSLARFSAQKRKRR